MSTRCGSWGRDRDAPVTHAHARGVAGLEPPQETRHQDELAAEAAGIPYSQYKAQKKPAPAAKQAKGRPAQTEEQEERQLARSMMRQKDRKLLRKIEAGDHKLRKEVRGNLPTMPRWPVLPPCVHSPIIVSLLTGHQAREQAQGDRRGRGRRQGQRQERQQERRRQGQERLGLFHARVDRGRTAHFVFSTNVQTRVHVRCTKNAWSGLGCSHPRRLFEPAAAAAAAGRGAASGSARALVVRWGDTGSGTDRADRVAVGSGAGAVSATGASPASGTDARIRTRRCGWRADDALAAAAAVEGPASVEGPRASEGPALESESLAAA